ncbi:MAG: hypothetical protein COS82_03015 [Zetaproteobacteria bacterium CG06_land_8_20_14_3_00_59_53]|nr:MAG: hypothetical protein AUK36_01395 [Zetaproteobacteria bacterium CG2_30_59_37]PIQ64114.1 MAG: hypothetical protein COV97_10930 [Zetaproteobacteria bacterium CG11_big_fil_rev_8_21_14_0_20_59_439]PIU71098.1 MAG: hypothetical protein COS82_03015 [Zetaproteobacteria bacterium CG06_land_8_20_14_3_00_59_53]PIY46360.1 MAG: hypothetical protein COZ02_05920 [Zetaproteobacteria bacterium CG_4_10_14_0_8_um_filter_59_127]PJC19102.1 MAG: hypothetical protein CO062_01370 [Zetaproteobacteria bacterium C
MQHRASFLLKLIFGAVYATEKLSTGSKEPDMNIERARRIAHSFAHVAELHVEELSGGLLVQHDGNSSYFVRESCFWPFVFKSAGASQADVLEIESRLEQARLVA